MADPYREKDPSAFLGEELKRAMDGQAKLRDELDAAHADAEKLRLSLTAMRAERRSKNAWRWYALAAWAAFGVMCLVSCPTIRDAAGWTAGCGSVLFVAMAIVAGVQAAER